MNHVNTKESTGDYAKNAWRPLMRKESLAQLQTYYLELKRVNK
jgi:hypothetical protein